MSTYGLYEEGTKLSCKKAVEIVVFKDDGPESYVIEEGTECVISADGLFPTVEISCDAMDVVLRVRIPFDFDWRGHFSVKKYRHLSIVK